MKAQSIPFKSRLVERFCILFALILLSSTFPLIAQDTLNAVAWIEKGIALQDEEKYQEALACFSKVGKHDPNYPWAVYETALTLKNANRLEAALDRCNEAFDLRYEIPQLYSMKGSILDELGKPEEGNAILDSALKRWPYNQNILFNKAVCLLNSNQLEEAERVLRKSIEINPFHRSSHLGLAKVNLYMGRTGEAYLAFNMAILMNPTINYITQFENAIFGKYDTLIHPYLYPYKDLTDSSNWKRLSMILNSGLMFENEYEFPFKPDYKVARMAHVLFQSIHFSEEDTSFYNQFYVRFFTQMMQAMGFEVYLNYFLQNTGNDQVKDWLTTNKVPFGNFIKWAQKRITSLQKHRFSFANETNGIVWYHTGDNGSLEAIGKMEANSGLRIGQWINLNENMGVDDQGGYVDGKKEGLWKVFWLNGTLKQKLQFTNDSLHGACYTYFMNGAKSGSYTFVHGKENGREEHYTSSGKLERFVTYSMDTLQGPGMLRDSQNWLERKFVKKANKMDGMLTETWLNGAKKYSCNYSDGLRNGVQQLWHPNDTIQSVEDYTNDTAQGAFTTYFQNGKKSKEGTFNELGHLQGIVTFYTRERRLLSVDSIYRDGKLTGNHREYYESGLLRLIIEHQEDNPTGMKVFDSAGKLIYQAKASNDSLAFKDFYPDGRLMISGWQVSGKNQGKWVTYGASGVKFRELSYLDGMLSGPQLTFYKNGRMKEKYECDSNRLVGLYEEFFQSGKVKLKGHYTKESATGDWLYFHSNDSVESISYLVDGHPSGRVISLSIAGIVETEVFFNGDGTEVRSLFYDRKGNLTCDYDYAFGASQGVVRYPNGVVHRVINVRDNLKDGNYEVYYPNGKLYQQIPYCEGKINGLVKAWDPEGNIVNESQYINGKCNGVQKLYNNGKLASVTPKEEDQQEGTEIVYDENGKVAKTIEYSGDLREGNSDYFSPDGKWMYRVLYWQDIVVGYTYQGANGKLLPMIPVTRETTSMAAFYRDGKPSMKAGLKNGLYHGKFTSWYPDGSIMRESWFDEDNEDGTFKTWNPMKKPSETITYQGGIRMGPYTCYHANGQVRLRGAYFYDLRDGDWELLDESGKVVEVYKYDKGEVYEIKTF